MQRDAHWTLNPLAFETDWRKRFCLERHLVDDATRGECITVLHFFMRSSDIEFRLRNVVITDDDDGHGESTPTTTVLVSTSPQQKAHFEHFAVHPLVVPDPHVVCLDCTAPKSRFTSKRFNHTHLHSTDHKHIRSLHPLEHAWLSNESVMHPDQMRLEGFFNLSTLDATSIACSILNQNTWVRVSMIGEERVTRNMMMLALEQVLRLPLRTLYPTDNELVVSEEDGAARLGDCLLAECEVRKFIDYASADAHIFGDAQRPVLYEASSYVLDQQQVIAPPTTPPKLNVVTRSNTSSSRLSETTTTTTTPPRTSTCSNAPSSKAPPSIKARRRRMQLTRRYKGY